MKTALKSALVAAIAVLSVASAKATTVDSEFFYSGPVFQISYTCSVDCSTLALQRSDFITVLVDFPFDTRGVYGTFTRPIAPFFFSGEFFAQMNNLPPSGSITLTEGRITAWSLSATDSVPGGFNATVHTSDTGDGEQIGIDLGGPFMFAIGTGGGPSGVWSDSRVFFDGVLQSNTPLPPALPLFLTGLGALGLMFRFGKRQLA